jgi:hypothetical protein
MADVTEVSSFNDIPIGLSYRVYQITEDTDIEKTIEVYVEKYGTVNSIYKIVKDGKRGKRIFLYFLIS